MTAFAWDESFSVGVDELDRQHRGLLQATAGLAAAMRENAGRRAVGQVVSELAWYAREHFLAEERLMAQWRFPGLDEHRAEHERFARRLGYFSCGLRLSKPGVDRELLDFLQEWLRHHLLGLDQQYAEHARRLAREEALLAAVASALAGPAAPAGVPAPGAAPAGDPEPVGASGATGAAGAPGQPAGGRRSG